MRCLGNFLDSFLGGHGVRRLAALAAAASSGSLALALDFHTVDFSSVQNYRIQNMDGDAEFLPTGNLVAGGTPFHITTGDGNNTYLSAQPAGGGVRSVDVNIGWFGVSEVHTLINSWWGTWSPNAYACVEFFGSGGAYEKFNLVGNRDIRDYLYSDYTNTINGTTTINAVTVGSGRYWEVRLDAQTFALSTDFRMQTLQLMRLTDQGDMGFQRTFLSGVTVGTVPEPETIIVVGALMVGLVLRRRWRSN